MNKIVIFAIGAVVGAAAGAGVTYLCMKDTKKTADIAEEKRQDYKDAVSTNVEELTHYYIQQLIDLGYDVLETDDPIEEAYDNYISEKAKSSSIVNPVEEENDEDEDNDLAPVEPNPTPYEIQSRDLGSIDFYECQTINWYKGDKTMCDEDYDIIDDWSHMIGDIEDRLMKETTDALYFRNEMQQVDYEVLIYEDSYKHAVEGEELGDMAD
jgi:hypothetical protein